jgi:hypothetical protein
MRRTRPFDDQVGQAHARQVERVPPHSVLEAGERRLRGQRRSRQRIAPEQERVDRVLGQSRGVVAVGVAAGDPVDAPPHQLDQLVLDLAGLPRVGQAGRQPPGHHQAVVERLEQHRPPIRTGVGLAELAHDRLRQPLELEGHLRYTVCSYRASSCSCIEAVIGRFYSTSEELGGRSLSSFTHKAG